MNKTFFVRLLRDFTTGLLLGVSVGQQIAAEIADEMNWYILESGMRNELAEVEVVCRNVVEQSGLEWSWDDYVGAMLATIPSDQSDRFADLLVQSFSSRWNSKEAAKAPAEVKGLIDTLGGIRETQHLFVTNPDRYVMAYGAWWPWGDGQTISIRIGLVLSNKIPEIDQKKFDEEFRTWFAG